MSSSNNFTGILGKLLTSLKQGLRQAKALLSKDYSLQDLKNLKSLPKTLQQKMSSLKLAASNVAQGSTQAGEKFHYKQIPNLVSAYVLSHRNIVIGFAILIAALVVNAFVVSPYAQRVQNQLDMRPAQWSQLQSLIKQAKSTNAAPVTVTLLDDQELQKIRNVLISRGIKPSVLRLTADNPPRIELQASDAMFSVLLDSLDELRMTWRLYPEQLNVVATSSSGGAGGAGMVNIGGVLVQHGGQSGTQVSGVSR
ncbi:type II secretion system protein M [Polynucleobacter sp. Ross1-W9]|uniref:type II secretion system protein M n=1 Tax=Polynucleobacter parvulilacunae TaxID=1855631 RepID=UPI001C0B88BB|nr:type II secretion system protein M [Polynucleobacter parvulilacunae]MBU3556863.1 type II secretion system protein M [Polynucleobacter parvulilacunae]